MPIFGFPSFLEAIAFAHLQSSTRIATTIRPEEIMIFNNGFVDENHVFFWPDGVVAMSSGYNLLVTSTKLSRAGRRDRSYLSIESALPQADVIFESLAESVWIVDRAGNLMLPGDQARVRLSTSYPSDSAI
jgi:hypothetical protein